MDRQTDRQTDGQTDKGSYKDSWTRKKTKIDEKNIKVEGSKKEGWIINDRKRFYSINE